MRRRAGMPVSAWKVGLCRWAVGSAGVRQRRSLRQNDGRHARRPGVKGCPAASLRGPARQSGVGWPILALRGIVSWDVAVPYGPGLAPQHPIEAAAAPISQGKLGAGRASALGVSD